MPVRVKSEERFLIQSEPIRLQATPSASRIVSRESEGVFEPERGFILRDAAQERRSSG
jgi:hypothetical protein